MWRRARPRFEAALRSYGKRGSKVQHFAAMLVAAAAVLLALPATLAAEKPVKVVVLGDSLSAGFQLTADESFPAQLERLLKAKGLAVEVVNAGVSGDTSAGGLSRLDWSVPQGTDAVIVELGANDMLRGIEPKLTRASLEQIIGRLRARGIEVLLCGMLASPNLGRDYATRFNAIYSDLAAVSDVTFYPFFLDGIVGDRKLNQSDGLHPTAAGVAVIVTRILPRVEDLLARVRAKRHADTPLSQTR
jgi:acyl-CoA thioesterase-1